MTDTNKEAATLAAVEPPTIPAVAGSAIDPGLIPFGAGTFRYGVTFEESTGKLTSEGTIIGATKGGGKFSIKPEILPLEADHLGVEFKGGHAKIGEAATMEAPFTEITADDIAKFTVGEAKEGTDCMIVKPSDIVKPGHYYENFAYVGRTADGSPVIVHYKNAICTSGFELEGKNKEQGASTAVFSCVADADAGVGCKLPWTIIWPNKKSSADNA